MSGCFRCEALGRGRGLRKNQGTYNRINRRRKENKKRERALKKAKEKDAPQSAKGDLPISFFLVLSFFAMVCVVCLRCFKRDVLRVASKSVVSV